MSSKSNKIIDDLALKVIDILGTSKAEIEKKCWMIVHEHHHGVMPTEYDIREVEEESGYKISNPSLKGVITFPKFDMVDDWMVFIFTCRKRYGLTNNDNVPECSQITNFFLQNQRGSYGISKK